MSEVRPLSFRRLPDEEASAPEEKPNWLSPRTMAVRPAFSAEPERDTPIALPPPAPAPEPEITHEPVHHAPLHHAPAMHAHEPMRRSSLPPRKSVYPGQRVSRMPPPPADLAPRPTPEQEAFADAALELASLRARILSHAESELLALSVHIAQVIIEREVQLDPRLHTTLARTAVLALGDTQSARLRVSRAAYRAITEIYGEAAIDVDGVRVELSMDASFDALSVVAEAGPSRVDGRMSERLAAVLRAMEAEHRRNNAEEVAEEQP